MLRCLRPSHEYWCTPPAHTKCWLFRGQADARWPLVASAYRNDQLLSAHIARSIEPQISYLREKHPELVTRLDADGLRRCAAIRLAMFSEQVLVNEFLRLADSLGLLQSGFVAEDRRCFLDRAIAWEPGTPPPEPDNGVALAQHHGIPTRLLDWTHSPLGAAWFAARDAQERLVQGAEIDHIAVWAVSLLAVPKPGRITIVLPRTGGNPFLRAQSGAFTWDSECDTEMVTRGHMTFQEKSLEFTCVGSGRPGLVKVVCPATECHELLHLLWIEEMTQAHLMPTLDNVARSVFHA